MTSALKWLSMAMGIVIVGIGIFHMAAGIDGIPDMGSSGVTADSQTRFFGGIFVGYGLAWIWAARQVPIATHAVHWLAGIFLLSGIARLISVAVYGWPHWFQIVLTAIEFALPPIFFWLAAAQPKRPDPTVAHVPATS
ncbi:DUF4345 domain-containing protein [Nocardia anaemiae]|uniref:DUF4345 domain-containing protein n=1 Tax=Nocardia anaemiae TaxID=263910 RepID=UPI0007A3CB0C|nr:DUF4345 domain-containing protein [Nocardia anaemiae]